MTAIFDYASFEDLKAFGETNDNEDTSNSLTALEAKPLSEAIADGWFSEGELVKAMEAKPERIRFRMKRAAWQSGARAVRR